MAALAIFAKPAPREVGLFFIYRDERHLSFRDEQIDGFATEDQGAAARPCGSRMPLERTWMSAVCDAASSAQ